jgi:hypothetical protein
MGGFNGFLPAFMRLDSFRDPWHNQVTQAEPEQDSAESLRCAESEGGNGGEKPLLSVYT